MNTHTEPTTYTSPIARFPTGSEDDADIDALAELFHARSTHVGITYRAMPASDRDAIRSGIAAVVSALGEALRPELGGQAHARLASLLTASLASGDCATILRHAREDLGKAIADDLGFRTRLAARTTSDGTAPPSELLKPGAEKEEGDT